MFLPWQRSLLIALFVIALCLAIGYLYQWAGQRADLRLHPAPGDLFHVGGHRLHLFCKGSSAPTVVIEQGAGELSRLWWPLQDEIANFARVCTYDRAGYAWSDSARQHRTIEDRAEDLHLLLTLAGVPGPYIFAAHSYGGLIVRAYAAMYPNEVAGLILIDTPEESSIFQPEVLDFYSKTRIANHIASLAARFGVLRLMRTWVPIDRYGFWLNKSAEYAALCDDLASLELVPQAQRGSKVAGTLGTLPVLVITHGLTFPGPFAVLETNWTEGQKRLAALSTNSALIVAKNSNHMVQQDEPELVLDAILRVHAAVSGHRKLD
jgi:pimeloyl-ACP methyl ester carboxylesterase